MKVMTFCHEAEGETPWKPCNAKPSFLLRSREA